MKDKSKLSNTEKLPAAYYKGKKMLIAVIVIASILVTVSVALTYDYFRNNNTYSLTYTCSGVDSEWLKNHPFDTSSFPTKLKRKDPLILRAPKIDSYTFVEWKIEWDESSLSLSSSSTFKDGETYKAASHTMLSVFVNKALVTAKYKK